MNLYSFNKDQWRSLITAFPSSRTLDLEPQMMTHTSKLFAFKLLGMGVLVVAIGALAFLTHKKKVSLLGMTELVLGRMFLGYAGLPLWNAKCNFPRCKRRQTPSLTMEY